MCTSPPKVGLALHFHGAYHQRFVVRLFIPIASWCALCPDPAYLVPACVLCRQSECSQWKGYLQFLMPALVLKNMLSFYFFSLYSYIFILFYSSECREMGMGLFLKRLRKHCPDYTLLLGKEYLQWTPGNSFQVSKSVKL